MASAIEKLAKEAVKNVKKRTQSFSSLYGTEADYLKNQLPLAEQGIAQQTNKYFLPQIDKGIADVRSELANRGLFRSGIRTTNETNVLNDFADQEAQQREALKATRESELLARYAKMQKDYEKAVKTGAKYKPSADLKTAPVINPTFNPTGQLQGDRYSPISAYQGTDSTSKFGTAYKNWYENRFKKTRPDVSYNI